jgi:hypothetical protein
MNRKQMKRRRRMVMLKEAGVSKKLALEFAKAAKKSAKDMGFSSKKKPVK